MHIEAFSWVCKTRSKVRDDPHQVLELGSLNVNGTARMAWPGVEWFGVDLVPGKDVDLVCDAGSPALIRQLAGRTFDAVVCMEVLEHAPNGADIIRNAFTVLRPGGRLWVTAAGVERPVHACGGGPVLPPGEHYGNVGAADLLGWLMQAGFQDGVIEDGDTIGNGRGRQDIYATFVKGATPLPEPRPTPRRRAPARRVAAP